MAKKSNVQRTLLYLRERKIKYAVASWYGVDRKRHDLLGIFDYLAFFPNNKLVGVQICGRDFQSHVKKIETSEFARMWIDTGNEILLVGWRELKEGWSPRIHKFERGDFQIMPPPTPSKYSTPKLHHLKP